MEEKKKKRKVPDWQLVKNDESHSYDDLVRAKPVELNKPLAENLSSARRAELYGYAVRLVDAFLKTGRHSTEGIAPAGIILRHLIKDPSTMSEFVRVRQEILGIKSYAPRPQQPSKKPKRDPKKRKENREAWIFGGVHAPRFKKRFRG